MRTVEHMTRVKIDHYLEVDFTSFMKTVDVLGGVKICTTRPLKDSYTGLDLTAGTHELDGGQALQYVRSRHADGSSDLGRMKRQQRFLAALMSQATSSGCAAEPDEVPRHHAGRARLGARRQGASAPASCSTSGGRCGTFTPSSSEFTTVPIGRMGYAVKGIGSTLKWDDAKSAPPLRGPARRPSPSPPTRRAARTPAVDVAPQQIRVQVENGTAVPGLGKQVDRRWPPPDSAPRGTPVNAPRQRRPPHGRRLRPPLGPFRQAPWPPPCPGRELRAVRGPRAPR